MTTTAKITAARITEGTELLTIVTPYTLPGRADRAPAKSRTPLVWRTVAAVDGLHITFTDGTVSSSTNGATAWQTRLR